MEDWMRDLLKEHRTESGELPPPWSVFPSYTRYTIGWRMGIGESYLWAWRDWYKATLSTPEARQAYLRRQRPAPVTWADHVCDVLQPERDRWEVSAEQRAHLLALGFIAPDAAYLNWRAMQKEIPPVPWLGGSDPASETRYNERLFTFQARCWAEHRAAGSMQAWLSSHPKPPPAWRPVRDALQAACADGLVEPAHGFARLAAELAAYGGFARPPWAVGVSAERYAECYDLDAHYADAWALWASSTFEDQPSWQAYLEPHPPPDGRWAALLAQQIAIAG